MPPGDPESAHSVNGHGAARVRRYLAAFLVAVLLLERLAIPLGTQQVPLIVPVALVIVAIAYARGALVIDNFRAPLTVVIALTAFVCTIVQVATGLVPSLFAIVLLVLLYLPALFRSTGNAGDAAAIGRLYLSIMTIAAIVSVLQLVLQYVRIPNTDLLADVVPHQFLLNGFHQRDPISYGSPLRRSNAYVFLEPSFLSLFLGTAVLVAVRAGAGWLRILILLAGMVPTLAGNGFVILIPGLVVILWGSQRRNLLSLLPGLVIAVVAAAATPLGALYLGRSTEASNAKTSSSFRFVQPYESLLRPSFDSPFHTLFGHGSGSAGNFLSSAGLGEVTQPPLPKVIYEYGVLGGVGILAVLVIIVFVGVRHHPWLAGIIPSFFFINASLLLATLVYFTLFWLALVPRDVQASRRVAARPPGELYWLKNFW